VIRHLIPGTVVAVLLIWGEMYSAAAVFVVLYALGLEAGCRVKRFEKFFKEEK